MTINTDQRPTLHVDVTSTESSHHGSDYSETNIYRGGPPSPIQLHSHSIISSSSSSSSLGRLGAVAAVVELAITRWAKRNSLLSSSSSSSSSQSSNMAISISRSQQARVRTRRSAGTLHSLPSEDIIARINRLRALEESRRIPRKFALYLPPLLLDHRTSTIEHEGSIHQVTWTESLPFLLNLLDSALRKAAKVRRNRHRIPMLHNTTAHARLMHNDYMLPDTLPHRDSSSKPRKYKSKEATSHEVNGESSSGQYIIKPKAWFLDIASPTGEDMRAIGKLLHLHPLTLEDILHRDPREKLELFSKLGYYFISFRAIESQQNKNIRRAKEIPEATSGHDDAPLGEANVYLVVFEEGICVFHFTDISEHMDRVRNRIKVLEGVINMSSDWIAHGILDSMVDSFFPVVEEIEREVMAIEDLVLTATGSKVSSSENDPRPLTEKSPVRDINLVQTHFSLPQPTFPLTLRRLKRAISRKWKYFLSQNSFPQHKTTHTTLRRMARTRRLVTSLARLLATKSELVAQIRKRLLTSGKFGLSNGSSWNEDVDVAIYMGDVQDHILTLQLSLVHYERILSQSHPVYLSQLRTGVALAKNGTDKAIIYLTVVSIAVLCIQTIIGIFSLNVTIPGNIRSPDGHYYAFGSIIAFSILVLCCFVSLVRRWWVQAKRRRRAVF